MGLAKFLKVLPIDVRIRWLIRRDHPEVLEIERLSFAKPWDEDDLLGHARERHTIGMVAERPDGRVAGFMVFWLMKEEIRLIRFAVHPDCRRLGVGRVMVDRLVRKLSPQRRRLVFCVRETNLSAQRFYREQGIRAVAVERGGYVDPTEDAYVFAYEYGEDAR